MRKFPKILFLIAVSLFSWGLSPLWAEQTEAQKKAKLQYYYLEALRQKQAGNISAAVDNLYRCNSLDNNCSEVFVIMSDINMERNYPSVAIEQMKKASALEPDNVEYKKRLANHAVNAMDLDLATQLFEELVVKDPKHKNYHYYYLANIYAKQEKYQQAIDAWDGFEKEEGINERVCHEKFKLYAKLHKEKKAFAEMDKLIKSAPKETKHIALKANLYAAIGKDKACEKCFKDGLKKFPDDPILRVEYGAFLAESGRPKEGMVKWLDVLQDKSVSYLTKRELLYRIASDSLLDIDDSYYLDVINQYPDEDYPCLVYSSVLMGRGDTAAVPYLKRALAINPKHEDAWLTLINYYVMRHDTAQLVSASDESVIQYPENATLWDVHGLSRLMINDKETALASWKTASEYAIATGQQGLAASVFAKRGDLFMSMQQADSCFAAYDSSLVYAPNNVMVMNNYAYYLSVKNRDLDKAERMSLKTVSSSPNSPVFLDTYAWICFKKGEYSIAMLYIQQAYNNGGNTDPELLEHYGDILYKNGGSESECQGYWQRAYQIRIETPSVEEYINMQNLKQKAETGKYVE